MDFPRGPVVKNLPANAGDTSFILGMRRFHMPQGNWAHMPVALKPTHPRACAPQQEKHHNEKPTQHN